MIYESCCLLALPESSPRSLRNILEHSAAFWWGSQICQCSCQLYPDFQLYWGLNATSILQYHPFIYLRLVPSPSPVPLSLLPSFHTGTIARTMPGCHHIKRQRKREREKESEGQMKRETENYSAGRNVIVHQSKAEGKKLPLKLIIYPWEEKPQCLSLDVLLSLCVFVCLMVPTVYTLPVSTFTHCYQSPFCGIKSSFPYSFFTCIFLCSAAIFSYSTHTDNTP